MQESTNMNIVSAFVHEWAICAGAESVLHVKASTFKNIFPSLHNLKSQEVDAAQNIPKDSSYDLILGDLPIGMNQVEWNDGTKIITAQRNWLEILKSLISLEANGTALFLLEPLGFNSSKGIVFEKELNERGFFVNAFINCPERILQPETTITPIFVAISKNKTNQLFVTELVDDAQAREVARAYFSNINEGNLARGKYIDAGDYSGFHRLKIKEQIERLETQYKTYEAHCLGDLAVEINYIRTGEQLQERDNAIYIPRIGNSQVIYRLKDAKLKHHNYFQIVLRDSVLNEYVASFFRSALGRMIIDSLTSRTFIPHLNKKDIEQALIALPSLAEQKTIVLTQNKLHVLKSAIDEFDAELALNPTSSNSILGQLDVMLDAIDSLTDADRIRGIVREGETKYVEFKETLSLDIKKLTKEKYIEDSALKTVVAFLNTDGGKLLIGVSDDGQIPGLNAEIGKFHKNLDKFLLHWKNLLKNRIGEQYYPFIEYRAIKVDDKHVLFVECTPSQSACYLDGTDFYVRTNPATDKLEGPKLVEYVRNHFK
ncbi:MAG: RNA-binding domain-containing protein [Halobacteriota archaeon]